jgi:LmbE family N-acetylglucosaminyl deacetylase
LPAQWGTIKDSLEDVAKETEPDLIFAPRVDDLHQDHRLVAELVPTVWRDALVLNYEIPKWDGDLGRANYYVPISDDIAHKKVDLLFKCFPSQSSRDWWSEETFLSIMRLRGMECRSRYAEGFAVAKAVLVNP